MTQPVGVLNMDQRRQIASRLENGETIRLYWVWEDSQIHYDGADFDLNDAKLLREPIITAWFFDNYFFALACTLREKSRISKTHAQPA